MISGDHRGDDQPDVVRDDAEVERHADAHEEEAEQDAAERLDVGLELVAVGALATACTPARKAPIAIERPADLHQRAPRRARRGARPPSSARAAWALARMRNIGLSSQRPAATSAGDRGEPDRDRDEPVAERHLLAAGREEGDEREQRHDREILEAAGWR